MKDHEKRELVDRLTSLAQEFADTQQLRSRIASEVLPAIDAAVTAERERMIADGWRQTRYVAPVTDCESCLTPDACAIRGQCGHYLRERA